MPQQKRTVVPTDVPVGRPPAPADAPAREPGEAPSTPALLNEAYTRVRVVARAYEHACGVKHLGALHTWMRSYGRRLTSIADQLQDEGARAVKRLDLPALEIFDECTCESPRTLLAEAELVQRSLLTCFGSLTERLDMDAELYDVLTEDYDELGEALHDIGMLKREYEAYLSGGSRAAG